MKFKYCFALSVILIVLLSLATAAASENVTGDKALASGVDNDDDLRDSETQSVLRDNPSGSDVDLSVVISVENIYHDDKFNRAGYTVPWTITAKVTGATAKNVKINSIFSDNMEIVSNTSSIGHFDPTTGIWDIGDLSSSDNASLLILTKLKADGRFKVTVNAQTTSNDINLSNNDAILKIKSGTGKKPSNTTKTSDQSGGLDDDDSPGSNPYNSFVVIEESDFPSGGSGDSSPSEKKSEVQPGGKDGQPSSNQQGSSQSSNGNQGSSSNGDGSSNSNGRSDESGNDVNSVAKSTRPVNDVVSDTLAAVNNILNFGNDDSSSQGDLPPSVVKAIAAQDYTKIPLMIFVAFLIVLGSLVGYDKIKS